jgi:hypothetical protein
MAEFHRFSKLARLLQQGWHRRMGRRDRIGEFKMERFSHYLRHAMAGIAAVFISGLLMVNGLAVSAHEVHSVAGILA